MGEAASEPPSSRSLTAVGDSDTGLTAAPCSLRFTTALLPAPAAGVQRGSGGWDTAVAWQLLLSVLRLQLLGDCCAASLAWPAETQPL